MASIHNLHLPNIDIESSSLNGLRGLATIHIMMEHYLSKLIGSMELPLFYLLCGFSLTLGYGRSTYQRATLWQTPSEGDNMFNSLKFYQNRFARIGPLYYLANALCLTCKCTFKCIHGSAHFWKTAVLTLTMTNSWTFIGWMSSTQVTYIWASFPFAMVSWYITTLSFYYLIFPRLLPALQTLTTSQLSSLIVWLHYIQCLPALLNMKGTGHSLHWVNIAHPLTRLPVFIMGIAAGLVRINGSDQNFNANRNFVHDILPWGFSQPESFGSVASSSESLESTWRWKVDRNSFLLIALIIVEFKFGTYWPNRLLGMEPNTWSQIVFVHMQLVIIVGLTQDGGKSIMSKILRLRPIQFLGQISLAIYLLHVYIRDLYIQHFGMNRGNRNTIAISFGTTLIVSAIITKIFSQPLQNFLKAKK